jgi:hypothetical protein
MTESQLRLLSRISRTQEGKDFVEEILKPMLSQNHIDLLKEGRALRDEIVGYGNCLLQLINLFLTCEERLTEQKNVDPPDWV